MKSVPISRNYIGSTALLIILFLSSFPESLHGQMVSSSTFFNSAAPGKQPVLFAEGIVSDQFGNRDMAISPSGDELCFTLQYQGGRGFSTILTASKKKGKWSKPKVAFFAGIYNDLEPVYSPDGLKLYFVSNRPQQGETNVKDYDIWCSDKKGTSWSAPYPLPFPVNTDKDEFFPSITRSGTIYFTRNMGTTDEDIVYCKFNGSSYDTAISLPATVNSGGAEFNAFVDPDERYILFTGYQRTGNAGDGDLFVSHHDSAGNWGQAINLGSPVNGPGLTYCPFVSPDKKYLFFTSSRGSARPPFNHQMDLPALKQLMTGTLNGWDNIYWMELPEILK